jgi:Tol biopolymer transport system component
MHRSWFISAAAVIAISGCTASPASTPPRSGAPSSLVPSAGDVASPSVPSARSTPTATAGWGGPWIAYQGGVPGKSYGVHLVRLDGSDIRWPMSKVPGQFQEHPDWSPDGKRLTFSVTASNDTEDIWVADLDGANAERIVDCEAPCVWADEPAWSPDGRSIVFQRATSSGGQRTSTIERWDASTKATTVLLKAAAETTFYAPRWSPDGRSLVAEHATNGKTIDDAPIDNAIVVIDLGATVPTMRAITDPTLMANNPDWSPRGDLIIFSLPKPRAGFDGPADLYTMAPAGGPMHQVTSIADAGRRATQPTFSPDGMSVLFLLEGGTDQGLAIVPVTGGDPRSAAGATYVDGVHPRVQPTP